MKALKLMYVLLAGILVFSACGNLSTREELLVGKWNLSSYTDNQQRTIQQQAEFQESIAGYQIDLDIFGDGTFERVSMMPGAPAPEKNIGEWYLENDEKILTMKVDKAPLSKLLIVEVSNNKMVLRVEEGGVSTTLTFVR